MNARTIGYWATTGLLSFALLASGGGKLAQAEPLVQSMDHLGYPIYLLTVLGAWYIAAAVALLSPGFPRIKEWAYAGVTFAMTGALASHLLTGDPVAQSAPVFVLLALTAASYVLRPASRRLDAPAASSSSALLQPAGAK